MRAWKAIQCVLILLVASPLALAQHDDADEEEKEAKVFVNSRLIDGFFKSGRSVCSPDVAVTGRKRPKATGQLQLLLISGRNNLCSFDNQDHRLLGGPCSVNHTPWH